METSQNMNIGVLVLSILNMDNFQMQGPKRNYRWVVIESRLVCKETTLRSLDRAKRIKTIEVSDGHGTLYRGVVRPAEGLGIVQEINRLNSNQEEMLIGAYDKLYDPQP